MTFEEYQSLSYEQKMLARFHSLENIARTSEFVIESVEVKRPDIFGANVAKTFKVYDPVRGEKIRRFPGKVNEEALSAKKGYIRSSTRASHKLDYDFAATDTSTNAVVSSVDKEKGIVTIKVRRKLSIKKYSHRGPKEEIYDATDFGTLQVGEDVIIKPLMTRGTHTTK